MINNFYRHRLTVKESTGLNMWGNKTYGSGVTYMGRVQPANRNVLNDDGEEQPVDVIAFVDDENPLDVGDVFSFESVNYTVIKRQPRYLGNGQLHHVELMAEKRQDG